MRAAFRDTLLQLAASDDRVIFLTGDLGFGVLDAFIERFPDRYINVGVAEAQLVTCAAGLALEGWRPIVYSIASFMTGRAFEQIRIAVGYHELPVTIIGAGGGYTYATSGVSHHAKEDFALMALVPGMAVVSPGDPIEVNRLLPELVRRSGPSYMRIGRYGEPSIESAAPIALGRGRILREGERVCLVSTGGTMAQVMDAANLLQANGYSPTVAHFHTLTPFDGKTFDQAVRRVDTVIVVEDHGIRGGLGSILQNHLFNHRPRLRFLRLGPGDEHVIGNPTPRELQQQMHYDAPSIAAAVAECWNRAPIMAIGLGASL